MHDLLKNAKGILFDLDNTLYPKERGVFTHINERISQYVALTAALDVQDAAALRQDYVRFYGTTLGGLMKNFSVDPEDYLRYVHDVPVEEMLGPDEKLEAFLSSVQLPMIIFTNATCRHARRVLNALGVSRFFLGICDLGDTGYLGKPHPEAFRRAARMLDCPPEETIFVDDRAENIEAGKVFGNVTVHVDGHSGAVGHFHVNRVGELEPLFAGMPWWKGKENRRGEAETSLPSGGCGPQAR